MELRASDTDPCSDQEKTAKDLLHHRQLVTSCGEKGAYEIHTTMSATRPAWRYRCSVLLNGHESEEVFPAVYVDRTATIREAKDLTEAMRLAFALEAVEAHCAMRSRVVAALPTRPQPKVFKLSPAFLAVFGCAALLLVAYYFFRPTLATWWTRRGNGAVVEQTRLWWERHVVSQTLRSGQDFTLPLPQLQKEPQDASVTVVLNPPHDKLPWLTFDANTLRLHGKAPVAETDTTHKLVFRARAKGGGESLLQLDLAIQGKASQAPPQFNEKCVPYRLRGEPCPYASSQ